MERCTLTFFHETEVPKKRSYLSSWVVRETHIYLDCLCWMSALCKCKLEEQVISKGFA